MLNSRPIRCAIVTSVLASASCSPRESPPEPVAARVPARVAISLTPSAESFVVGTTGQLTALAFDSTGLPMDWSAPRRIDLSDSTVLSVSTDGAVRALRLGTTWIRLTWVGPVLVRDSVRVRVGVRASGRVRLLPFEGGCWVIEEDARTVYEPTNLPASFLVDGLRVRFAAGPSKYDGSFCMVGVLADLDSIRVESP